MAADILPIESTSIHRIQSGQVIVDLCSVVKELVENSLDAGATALDVRFKNYGLDAIEVQDNGTGISKENYNSVALKHHTSKLRSYEDLSTLHTFGFRGEALSSLCALSEVHVLTATKDEEPRGSRLDFQPSGKLGSTQVVAAQRGTVVVVESIFKNLPVRRQELNKNIKREYGKVLNLLQAYASVSTGVKFTVSNTAAKKKTQAFATNANKNVRENIANIFGQKAVTALTSLDLRFELQSTAPKAVQSREDGEVQIQGLVSKPITGEGRQTPDRQMFFVNSRPCNLPQIAKIMNEVYKSYNLNQSPFIFANLIMDTNAYDVNVSPDKRQILLHEQAALLESLKAALIERFDNEQQTMPQTITTFRKIPSLMSDSGTQSPSTPANQATTWLRPRSSVQTVSSPGSIPTSGSLMPSQRSPVAKSYVLSSSPKTGLLYEFQSSQPIVQKSPTAVIQSLNGQTKTLENRFSYDTSRLSEPHLPQSNMIDSSISTNDFDLAEIAASASGSSYHASTFNRRMQELQQDGEERRTRSFDEESIPSIHSSPAKGSQGVVPNAFERMRPMRAERQTATITIGDHTTVEDIGFSQRMARSGRFTGPSSKKAKAPNAQFSKTLLSFFAPGTQSADKEEELEEESDESPVEERFVPEWPRRGPNKPSRGIRSSTRETRELPSTGSIESDGSSSDGELVKISEGVTTHRSSIMDGGITNTTTSSAHEEAADSDDSGDDNAPGEGSSDEEWLDEDAKRAREDARVARMIREAEAKAARPSADHVKRAQHLLKGGHRVVTTRLIQDVNVNVDSIVQQSKALGELVTRLRGSEDHESEIDLLANTSAEERLSLSVSKADFRRMRVVGQFNLGFILAVRPGHARTKQRAKNMQAKQALQHATDDELFIVDQHASDEKSNFERLSATTVLQSQRLVHSLPLELTAVEREIVAQHQAALLRNGFSVKLHEPDDSPAQQSPDPVQSTEEAEGAHTGPSPRATLLSLPASRETTFSPADLAELLALLPDDPHARPSRVRRLLAMRACRSSIMIGKALTPKQMAGVVGNLGNLEKPWNCPHGRPTMRHVVTLGRKMGIGCWKEGDGRGEGDFDDDEASDRSARDNEDSEMLDTGDADENGQSQKTAICSPPDWTAWLAAQTATTDPDDGDGDDCAQRDPGDSSDDEIREASALANGDDDNNGDEEDDCEEVEYEEDDDDDDDDD